MSLIVTRNFFFNVARVNIVPSLFTATLILRHRVNLHSLGYIESITDVSSQ